jgi:hypothetical protein
MPRQDTMFIDVAFAPNGRPSVTPDECRVSNGTEIVWRTAPDVDVPFEIDFEDESVAGRDAPRKVRSDPGDSRQKVRLTSDNESKRYKYAIEANGKRVDPAVIIER